ncbi:hypothetical protein IF2G_09665 [Cordyceps javanica]|nr:hypothetical protein IF2G_09665 [Cordyceps javanica]
MSARTLQEIVTDLASFTNLRATLRNEPPPFLLWFQLVPIGEECCPRRFKMRALPPESEVMARRHLYEPVPVDDVEIDSIPLAHLLKSSYHQDTFWKETFLQKLSAELCRPAGTKDSVIGWGVRINESLNWSIVLLGIIWVLTILHAAPIWVSLLPHRYVQDNGVEEQRHGRQANHGTVLQTRRRVANQPRPPVHLDVAPHHVDGRAGARGRVVDGVAAGGIIAIAPPPRRLTVGVARARACARSVQHGAVPVRQHGDGRAPAQHGGAVERDHGPDRVRRAAEEARDDDVELRGRDGGADADRDAEGRVAAHRRRRHGRVDDGGQQRRRQQDPPHHAAASGFPVAEAPARLPLAPAPVACIVAVWGPRRAAPAPAPVVLVGPLLWRLSRCVCGVLLFCSDWSVGGDVKGSFCRQWVGG